MLLTSAQVSVAVSSSIVIFFTAALFLSGYVIQQRTLQDLRAAIKPKPRPSPDTFPPDSFRQSTTELPDGSVAVVDNDQAEAASVVEVRPTLPNADTRKALSDGQRVDDQLLNAARDKRKRKKKGKGSIEAEDAGTPQKPISRAERRRRIKEEIAKLSQGQERGYYQRRLW